MFDKNALELPEWFNVLRAFQYHLEHGIFWWLTHMRFNNFPINYSSQLILPSTTGQPCSSNLPTLKITIATCPPYGAFGADIGKTFDSWVIELVDWDKNLILIDIARSSTRIWGQSIELSHPDSFEHVERIIDERVIQKLQFEWRPPFWLRGATQRG